CKIGVPEGFKVDNVCIYDGYLYCCEADKGTIWRIEVTDFVDSEDKTDVNIATDTSGDYAVVKQGPAAEMDDVISGDTWELVALKEGSVFIEGICINSQGELWFVDVAFGAIYHVNSETGEVETVYSNADGDTQIMPNGAKFVSDTQLLITDRFIGLALFDTETCEFTTLLDKDPDGNAFLGLNDLSLKDNGDGTWTVFFTDSGSKSYYTDTYPQKGNVYTCVVDPEAKTATDFELVAKGIAYPNGVTVDPAGTYLYVTEFAENQVLSIPTDMGGREGIRIFARLYGGIGPDGAECDKNFVYCAHLEAGEVVVLDLKGYEVCKIGIPDGFKVDNVCVNDGYLYCCDADNGAIWRIPMA
ncbi:MAG: SMP-30/gluconolactonase/LRE family protein, partial [Oscillospiraceae bacterium]|nr:SMP-30/gluconolactonase/LRE family protein [Oscillospiraceae bacterium]